MTVVNGAHDIFLSWLANEGVPGFILIVALLGLGLAWAARTFRSRRIATNAPGSIARETSATS